MNQSRSGQRIAALVVVYNQVGEVLLVRSMRRAERWELPGGIVEAGESPMSAARREVAEEVSLHIQDLDLVGLYYGTRDHLLRLTFSATVGETHGSGKPPVRFDGQEILAASWFQLEELPSPIPLLARQMIEDSSYLCRGLLREVADDKELG